MTQTLTVTTKAMDYPAGTLPGSYRVTITPSAPGGQPSLVTVPYPAVPTLVTLLPGTYSAVAQLLDGNGNVLTTAPASPISVPSTVTLQGPTGVALSITFA